MNKVTLFWLIVVLCLCRGGWGFPVAFLGVKGDVAPALHERLNEQIRLKLESSDDITLYSYNLEQRLKSEIDFNYNNVVSRELVEGLIRFRADSTLVVWGEIDYFTLYPQRKGIFRAEAIGELIITLHMYSLGFKEISYIGKLKTSAATPLSNIGFSSIKKHAHINPRQREEVIMKMIDTISNTSYQRTESILIHLRRREQPVPIDEMEIQKAPTLDDLFDIPSGDASDIDNEGGAESAVEDLFDM